MKFGDVIRVKETESGKWSVMESECNFGHTSLDDLTDEQRKEMKIQIFETEKEARKEMSRLFNEKIKEMCG